MLNVFGSSTFSTEGAANQPVDFAGVGRRKATSIVSVRLPAPGAPTSLAPQPPHFHIPFTAFPHSGHFPSGPTR